MPIIAYYELSCDDCSDAYPATPAEVHFQFRLRESAEQAGWQVPPIKGKGSRSTSILCPACVDKAAEARAAQAGNIASLAAHVKWAACPDRAAATAAARESFAKRWEQQVDPDGTLDPAERATRGAEAKRAHYARLAEKSAEVRRAKAIARQIANGNGAMAAVNTDRAKRWQEARQERLAADPTLAPHGVASTYTNWGCRCQPCADANREAYRQYKAGQRADS